jgi:hypothetical protein
MKIDGSRKLIADLVAVGALLLGMVVTSLLEIDATIYTVFAGAVVGGGINFAVNNVREHQIKKNGGSHVQ